jgi:hypothetical protein
MAIFNGDTLTPLFLSIFDMFHHPSGHLQPNLGHFYRFECEKISNFKGGKKCRKLIEIVLEWCEVD